ncbi:MAG TPA: hypothetical protein VGO64_02095, partial [Candidatus Limnocylindrales bacterium]|nr:hypothetical protein [Candidatus Limnocylindrales bacterium]
TQLITAEIDVHAVMLGNHDFVFRNLWVHGGEALLEGTREPYPLHAYDRTIVSIVTAFYPRMRAGFRAGIYADSAPPIFDLRDIHIENLNLTVHFTPYAVDPVPGSKDRIAYTTTARLEGVDVDVGPDFKNDSYLYMDATDPLVAKFYVRLAVVAKRGVVRIFDEGPRSTFRIPVPPFPAVGGTASEVYPPKGRESKYEIALADIHLNRLAQLPTEWPRHDFVANTLELDLQARTLPCATPEEPNPDPARGASIHLTGELNNYWDRPYDGSWNLALDTRNLGPTIRTCIKSTIGGDELDGRIDLVNEQGYIDKTKALIRGGKEPGEVDLSATFGLKPYNAHANIEIAKAIDVGRFLGKTVPTAVGKYLQGRLRANGDAEVGFALDDFDLSLGMTPTDRAIRVHRGRLFTDDGFDSIKIEKVAVDAGRSRAVFDGMVKPLADRIDLTINGDFPDLDVWLTRFGIKPLISSAHGGTIRITGKLTAPTINVATELGGVPCLDKVRVDNAVYEQSTGTVDAKVRSGGLGGELTGDLRLNVGGATPRIDKLHFNGKRLESSRLCGLKGIVKGTLDSIEVDVANTTIDRRRSAMDWLDHVKVYARADKLDVLGDRYERVGVCLNRRDDQVCRPRPGYLDGDDVTQCEQGKQNGFCAVATATRPGGGLIDATVAKLPAIKTGRQSLPARLGGTIALYDLPIAIL